MGLTVHFEVLNQLGTPMMYSSSLASRPAAGIQGRIFFRTDSPYGIYRDNGTSWDIIAAASAGITGSGAATQIAYFDSATNLTSSANLFWDNTNARLGINTATPGSSLDVHSTAQSIIQANNTTLGNSFASFQLQGTGKWQIGNVYNAGANYFRIQDQLNSVERLTIQNTGEIDILGYQQTLFTLTGITGTTPSALPNSSISNSLTFNSGITTAASVNTLGLLVDNILNYSGANTINVTSYNASALIRNGLTFGSAAASVTYTQGTGIKALVNSQNQYIQNGANSGTISHYANIQILGDQKTGVGLTTFTNRYGLLINDYNEFTAGNTYTNRWGIYQAGLNESNFFAGKVGIGSGYVPSTFQLDVNGTARVSGDLTILNNKLIVENTINNTAPTMMSFINIGSGGGTGATFQFSYSSTLVLTYGNGFTFTHNGTATPTRITSSGIVTKDLTASTSLLFQDSLPATIKSNGQSTDSFTFTGGGSLLFQNYIGSYDTRFAILKSTGNVLIQNGGTFTDITSARLAVNSSTQGFLPPRMTTAEKNAIGSPAQGLMVFDTTLVKLCVYSGSAWETITSI
jgi:hypothetical protein